MLAPVDSENSANCSANGTHKAAFLTKSGLDGSADTGAANSVGGHFFIGAEITIQKKLTQIDDSTPTKLYDGLVKSIHQAAEESLGEVDNGRNKKSIYWWNDFIKESIEEKKRAYNEWLTTKDSEDRKYYTRISREVKNDMIKRMNKFWDAKCEEVDQYLGRDQGNLGDSRRT
ncbi:hypothetical protein HHI36_019852 [Cryptolaemus montrouzieri]|uniref:Plasmodium falciparum erythrocyte membrane protein-1 N-terminal segment domain-containing protein n=1 Tax=Cryptolaemus montrouzieri TaxID=559131 RepID=A0ABD2N9B2_9CUCU